MMIDFKLKTVAMVKEFNKHSNRIRGTVLLIRYKCHNSSSNKHQCHLNVKGKDYWDLVGNTLQSTLLIQLAMLHQPLELKVL